MTERAPAYLIVDDERLARSELRRMISRISHPVTILEAESAEKAIGTIVTGTVDALFLDIEMPGGSGFDLLDRLGEKAPPVIFTTAYSEFEGRAFGYGAVDYLLKPFGQESLQRAVERLGQRSAPYGRGDVILLKIDGECRLIPVEAIESITSLGRDGTTVSWESRGKNLSGHASQTLKRLASRLDPGLFFRVSRDRIINLLSAEILPGNDTGILTAKMRSGEVIPFSRRQSSLFRQRSGMRHSEAL